MESCCSATINYFEYNLCTFTGFNDMIPIVINKAKVTYG